MMDCINNKKVLYTLLKYLVILAATIIAYRYRVFLTSILSPFLISALLAYLLNPIVFFFEKNGLKRFTSVILVYIIFLSLAIIFGFIIIPKIFRDISVLVESIPIYSEQLQNLYKRFQDGYINSDLPQGLKDIIDDNMLLIENMALSFLQSAADSIMNFFSKILLFVTIPVITFYMLKDSDYFKNQLILILPKSKRNNVLQLFRDIDNVFGKYIRGQVFVSLVVGALTTAALLIIRVRYALILGLFASITNIIPYFGPIIGVIPAIIFAILDSPSKALYTIGATIIVQQFESDIITPKVIGESIGLHPIYVIMALLIGGKLMGITGLIIAVPLAAVIKLCVRHFLKNIIKY